MPSSSRPEIIGKRVQHESSEESLRVFPENSKKSNDLENRRHRLSSSSSAHARYQIVAPSSSSIITTPTAAHSLETDECGADDDCFCRNLSCYHDFSYKRDIPTYSSSLLRPGAVFVGTQQSGNITYEVRVEIKQVDMENSFLSGYLGIQGLAEEYRTLTTYFEGQIIGPNHSFFTRQPSWGATEKIDLQHWERFPSWRPLYKQIRRADYCHSDFAEREHLFMRWKECFLVPDHKVTDVKGASFEGFYYICFNQYTGSVSGLYYHRGSEMFQQLELSHLPDQGSFPIYEFR